MAAASSDANFQECIAIGQRAAQFLFVTVLIFQYQSARLIHPHEIERMRVRFGPPLDSGPLIRRAVAVQRVIEMRFGVRFAIVNVNRRKEQRVRVATPEIKRHRMQRCFAGFQLENGETVILVTGQLRPDIRR